MTADELRKRLIDAGERVTLADTITDETCAKVLGCATRTLRERRTRNDCPAFHYIGGRVYTSLQDVVSYLQARRHDPIGETRQKVAERGG